MKTILFTFYIFITMHNYIYAGYMDWDCKTPGGNEINDFYGFPILKLRNGQTIERIRPWFFYKDHIIGKIEKDRSFFIVNEKTLQINIFESEKEWMDFLSNNNLNPKWWTRWYSTDWTILDEAILLVFYGIPIFLIISFIFFRAIKIEHFNIRKPYTITIFVIIFLTLSKYIMEQFPQSI